MNGKTAKVVVLDRDGVVNRDSDEFIKSPAEWQPLPGSIEAIADLSRADFIVTLATNQSGLARGLLDLAALDSIHEKLRELVKCHGGAVDGIFYCPHGPEDGCSCRKPATGLLRQIEARFACSLRDCWFIGDSLRDLQAARTHGCRPVLVRTGNGSETENLLENNDLIEVDVFDDLRHAANVLLSSWQVD
ncbi:MAG: D-glycero-beta-D-manno-heptose 1,7-bisphosphate 7-phosphatase [Gammaproteobacteria bacterium]|nr:D-glycero-beta-D-manno-heptose 1,7-bisphosphate 7-phosphatase [Gammaproteobacteria bacterium]MCY3690112.1 D-glycero-beta-D-manno-heptose 1,7-bisphosphate 7-phosphatase [Gammaproteobacteria bacterium]MDE0509315.1 D-glycero-beta-D-manno-heptose 1,7-bisphosphate 7-phosphatase [Gammaproteobacteria bacterium]